MIAVVAVVAAFTIIIALMLAGRQRSRAAERARQLATGSLSFPAVAAVSAATTKLSSDYDAAEHLAQLACGVFGGAQPGAVPPGAELSATASALAELERAVTAYGQLADALTALAVEPAQAAEAVAHPDERQADRLTAALRDCTAAPADAGMDAVAKVISRLPIGSTTPLPGAAPSADDSIAATVAAITQAAGQRTAARTALTADLERLGLSGEWTDLNCWPGFLHELDAYDQRISALARELVRQVATSWDQQASALDAALTGRLAVFGREQAAELDSLVQQVRKATVVYARAVRRELAGSRPDTTETIRLLDALPDRLERAATFNKNGYLTAALAELAGNAVPLARSWPASEQYEAAWAELSGRLADFTAEHRRRAAREAAAMAAELHRRMIALGERADAARRQAQAAHDTAWASLEDAVRRVKQEAAEVLTDSSTSQDGADPVRAATAVMYVDQVAAANAAQLVREAFPVIQGKVIASDAVEDHLHATEKIMAQLGRNTVALSGLDGLLAPLLAATVPVTGSGLAVAMAQLTPVPTELSRALGDLVAFAEHPFSGITATGMMHGVVNHVEQNLVPHVAPLVADHGVLNLATSAVHNYSDLHGNLLASLLLGEDAPLLAAAKFVGGAVKSTYLEDVAHMPAVEADRYQLETAAHHAGHATVAVAPDLLHGVLAHVPFVTVALSTAREIRLYQKDATTLDQSVKNIAIDTASVATGLAAGEVAAHVVLGVHSAFLTVPFTIAGSLAARKIAKIVKQRPYREALTKYAEVEAAHSGKALELARELSTATRSAIGQQRSGYLTVVGQPPTIEQAALAELTELTTQLRAVTGVYVAVVNAVLDFGSPIAPAGTTAAPTLAARMAESLRGCDRQIGAGHYAEALLTLATMALPVPATWRPSRDYRARCAEAAARISKLSDDQREAMARWTVEAAQEFRERSDKVGAIVTRKAGEIGQERATAEAELREAADAVARHAAALGLSKPHNESGQKMP